jgi:iron complex outermembrane recepter protein
MFWSFSPPLKRTRSIVIRVSAPLPSREECARTGVSPAQYGHLANINASRFGYHAIVGGNADLDPEIATTRTIGLVLEPKVLGGFKATVDWWDIKLKGAVSSIGAQAIVDNCVASGDPVFCTRIHRDPNGSLWLGNGHVDNRQVNLGGFKIRGIDSGADYSTGLGRAGSASLRFRGSYVLRWVADKGGLSTAYDCVGLFGDPCGIQPRWKHTVRASWDTSRGMVMSLQWRHMAGLRLAAADPGFGLADDASPANAKLRSQDYFDAATVVRLGRGSVLRLGVNNVLDRQPPLVVGNTAAGEGPFNGNTYPQWYDPLGRYLFASLGVELKP